MTTRDGSVDAAYHVLDGLRVMAKHGENGGARVGSAGSVQTWVGNGCKLPVVVIGLGGGVGRTGVGIGLTDRSSTAPSEAIDPTCPLY